MRHNPRLLKTRKSPGFRPDCGPCARARRARFIRIISRVDLFPAGVCAAVLGALLLSVSYAAEEETFPFTGEVTAEDINLRADSTTSSEVICKMDKGAAVEILSGQYGWYKVRLPDTAPSYIRADMVSAVEAKSANFTPQEQTGARFNTIKVERDRVNIRLRPNESAPIIGRVSKNEVLNFTGMENNWYRVKPVSGSYGWIHADFVRKAPLKAPAEEQGPQPAGVPAGTEQEARPEDASAQAGEDKQIPGLSVYEGVIKPYGMVFKRPATHKLVASDKKIFLLKGDKQTLNALVNRKARVSGKPVSPCKGLPVVEVVKIEAID